MREMDATAYRDALRALGLSVAEAGRRLGVNERTAQRFATEGPTPPAAAWIRLMLARRVKPLPFGTNPAVAEDLAADALKPHIRDLFERADHAGYDNETVASAIKAILDGRL